MTNHSALGLTPRDAGIEGLQVESLRLLVFGIIPAMMVVLILGAVDLDVRERVAMGPAVASLAAAAILPYRLANRGVLPASVTLVAGLEISTILVHAVYPSTGVLFALALASMIAATFLGWRGLLGAATVASALTLAATAPTDGGASLAEAGPILFMIWASGGICWLATRPTRVALDWSWNSYVQALERTEALRDRQRELVRISHDLAVACERLEEANQELDRARRDADVARRLKSDFAAAISHELRTPLNLIIGFSEMIVRDLRAPPALSSAMRYRGDVEAIYRSACHLSNLVDDVLDLSQVDVHRLALQKQRVSLAQIVEEARATLGTMLDEVGLGLRLSVPEDLPPVHADPLRIRQVLINLLGNAVRHTDAGEITVTAHREGQEVVVSVADTGDGIAAEDLPWVFEEFRQFGAAGRRRGGSGLGLAVTRRFVEMHGGNIWADSKPGEGSTFHFTLPLQEQVVSLPPPPNWGRLLGPMDRAGEKALLIVDPDPETVRLLRSYLDGYQVVEAASVAEAARFANQHHVEALVVNGPISGEQWRDLTTGWPASASIPVLTCALPTAHLIGEELGVSAYLVKPVLREALLTALRGATRRVRSVLIVDDDADLATLLERMIMQAHRRCRVSLASDGASALDLLRSQRPDVVLLDLLMPGMDGYGVLAAMKSDPLFRGIPVVVVTARGAGEGTVTARSLNITRTGGLAVGELVCCMKGCLAALADSRAGTTSPASIAGYPG